MYDYNEEEILMMVASDFYQSIDKMPKEYLEQIYFAVGAELQDREVTAKGEGQ
jgi:hypothetical protein